MDTSNDFSQEFIALNQAIDSSPLEADLYLQRGKLYHRTGEFHHALNDFIRVRQLSDTHPEAEAYITLLREIFAFRHAECYNP